MARAVWTGAISFGLVTIPVGLYSATEDHSIHFHQYVRGTSDRVRNQRVDERTGDEISSADIVKGRDAGDGEIVVVEPDELTEIAPGRSQAIEVIEFVDLADIDPVYFNRTYWIAPTDAKYAHPYGLLRQALAQSDRVGIATFVMRGREYLTALRADGDVLALQTLFFADEVRDPADEIDQLPVDEENRPQEVEMAVRLIDSMTADWHPETYRDTYTERVEQLVADKREGRETVPAPEPEEATEVTDLLDALRRSVEATGAKGSGSNGKSGGGPGDSSQKAGDTARSGGGSSKGGSSKGGSSKGGSGKGGSGKFGGSKESAQSETSTAGAAATSTRGDEPAADPSDDLAGLSKTELGRRARELDVPGRSTMTRDELVRAVADAGASTSGAQAS